MPACQYCGASLERSDRFCGECGRKFDPTPEVESAEERHGQKALSPCRNCGATLGPSERFCGECGTSVEPGATSRDDPAKTEHGSRRQVPSQAVERSSSVRTAEAAPNIPTDRGQKDEASRATKKPAPFRWKLLCVAVFLVVLLTVGGILSLSQYHAVTARVAANMGYAPAMQSLGEMYENGQGVAMDCEEAMRWYRRAADRGNEEAMISLAWMYYFGRGVPQDYAEAGRWWRMAADKGNAFAMFHLGLAYSEGEGVAQDHAEAARWYLRAVDNGNVVSAVRLGYLYEHGLGVSKDDAEALRWYRIAADGGYEPAEEAIESLAAQAE